MAADDPLEFQPDPAQGKRVIPELDTNLAANVSPYVFFVVYPDKSIADKPKIQAEFLIDGQVRPSKCADLPAPDATGAIPMVINTAAKPGNLRTAHHGSARQLICGAELEVLHRGEISGCSPVVSCCCVPIVLLAATTPTAPITFDEIADHAGVNFSSNSGRLRKSISRKRWWAESRYSISTATAIPISIS